MANRRRRRALRLSGLAARPVSRRVGGTPRDGRLPSTRGDRLRSSVASRRRTAAIGALASCSPCHQVTLHCTSEGSKSHGSVSAKPSSTQPSAPGRKASVASSISHALPFRIVHHSLVACRCRVHEGAETCQWVGENRLAHRCQERRTTPPTLSRAAYHASRFISISPARSSSSRVGAPTITEAARTRSG